MLLFLNSPLAWALAALVVSAISRAMTSCVERVVLRYLEASARQMVPRGRQRGGQSRIRQHRPGAPAGSQPEVSASLN